MVLLPAPLGPTRAIIFTGLGGEGDIVKGGLADAVAKGDVAELDLAFHARELGQRVVLGDVGLGVEDGEDAFHGGDAFLNDGVGVDDAHDGRVEHGEQAEEGEEVAGREVGGVGRDEERAETEGDELAEAGRDTRP